MKKLSFLVCMFLIAFSVMIPFVHASETESISWYCVRNREHKQPTLDPSLKVIERYNAFYVDRRHCDDCADKVVYLTFDAGYENGNINRILDVLSAEEVTGAFFVLENLIVKNTDLVRRMRDDGHVIANHTATHRNMTKIHDKNEFSKELTRLEETYQNYVGGEMSKYYRPPEGAFSEENLRFATELGYRTVFWSFAYADWDNNKQPAPEAAKKKILDNVHNGAVILLHPTSKTNADILCDVIQSLKKEGYRFGSLDELTRAED